MNWKVDWMVNATKIKALEKLDYMFHLVGFPDELINNKILDDYYKDLKIKPNSFLKNMLNYNIFAIKKSSQRLRKSVLKNEWSDLSGASTSVNAFHITNFNSIRKLFLRVIISSLIS